MKRRRSEELAQQQHYQQKQQQFATPQCHYQESFYGDDLKPAELLSEQQENNPAVFERTFLDNPFQVSFLDGGGRDEATLPSNYFDNQDNSNSFGCAPACGLASAPLAQLVSLV